MFSKNLFSIKTLFMYKTVCNLNQWADWNLNLAYEHLPLYCLFERFILFWALRDGSVATPAEDLGLILCTHMKDHNCL